MSWESDFSFFTARIRIGIPGSSFTPRLSALEYRKRICSNWSAKRRAVFSPSLLATMKCGVWTSVQVSGLSAGAGLPLADTSTSSNKPNAETMRAHRLGDITKCVSHRFIACQGTGVTGNFVQGMIFHAPRIDSDHG